MAERQTEVRRTITTVLAGSVLAALVQLVVSGPASAATRYEAENATISQGVVESNHLNFSGTGFVNGDNIAGSYTQFTFNAASAGTATLVIRYANGTTSDRPADVAVNGTVVSANRSFPVTANWDTWANSTITAPVNAGSNTLRLTATTAGGNPNLDYVDVDVVAAPPPGTVYQAEDATLSQAGVFNNHLGYTGTGFVDYVNTTGGYVEFNVNAAAAGPASVVVRYANGTTTNRPLEYAVNGSTVATRNYNATANWDTWADDTFTVNLAAGANTIRATATTVNGGPNLDKISVSGSTGGGGDTQAPSVPSGLAVGSTTSSSISLSWSASTDNVGVTGYKVYEGSTVVASPSGTSATISGLAASSSHTYTVSAVDAAGNESAKSASVTGTTTGGSTGPSFAVAPYEYLGWGNPQSPTSVMTATGIKWFTLAFMLSDGTCNPAWDGSRPLTGGSDQSAINSIRNAGGDIVISFGGWSGNKLGEHCSSASALAGAYQKVINAYNLKVIDIDIEATEFTTATVRQRVIDALKIVKTNNPGIKTVITMGTTPSGPDADGTDLINRGAAAGFQNDVWTIMPFDFNGHTGTMGQATVSAMEGLKAKVKAAYGYSDSVAYNHIGLSSMNGKTDEADETVTTTDFQTMLSYAQQHHIGRLTFWSINRDRQCAAGSDADACSGVSQSAYAFTKIFVQYTG
ncbi:carbohydrate-binding protein [Planotetraspora sp. A-T 1434]|uniref:CBM35 domain-containing protein n=1 Tax=Planotetraspora sp. A-T 1434 TaxID=2979219 RepID=UPI0021BFAFDE|nr:CBM35 domain-containing protein [Planotetraspora sp. A-T 1434]MCT9929021.1 carbohydrate-binding protein [Planotetraspora sp. A-T 1434]